MSKHSMPKLYTLEYGDHGDLLAYYWPNDKPILLADPMRIVAIALGIHPAFKVYADTELWGEPGNYYIKVVVYE